MATKSVIISVERLLEQEVDEINRDGEEKYIKPFDFSEELTHLAQKVDFYEGIQGHDSELEEKEEEDKKDDELKKEEDAKNENEWHWSSVHSKLRLALSEMSIMLDVLQTLNKKRYLILDPIQQTPEQEKQTVQMFEKRNYLVKVGTYIGKGAAALCRKNDLLVKSEPIVIDEEKDSSKNSDYYTQLMELRQFWRVKKSGSQITGDLSYRTSGSRFWHPGVFEVKIDNEDDESTDETKKLNITVSPDLAKTSEIIIQVIDGERNDFQWKAISIPVVLEDNFVNSWETDMSKAQQHLFNKEIFSQLSNDAFQGSFLGIDVLNSQIRCKLPDNAEVVITHNVDSSTPVDTQTETKETSNDLTFLLSALLYQQHRNASKFSTPYPATSNFYGKQSKSSSVANIIHRKPNEVGKSILYEFIKQTEHKLWVHRVNDFLYKQNLQILEPTIGFHWNVLKSRLKSVLTITLSTSYLHKSFSSSFVVVIDEKGFHIYAKDVIDVNLPFDMGLLNLVLENSIYKHLQSVVEILAKQHGWILVTPKMGNNLLAPTNSSNVTLLLKSFCQNKFVQLKLNDMRNIKVEASKNAPLNGLFLDEDFNKLNKVKFNVPWSSLPGKSFVDKIQSLMIFC